MRDGLDHGVGPEPRIAAWKIVAGGFLHFGVVAYLLVVPAMSLVFAPRGATAEQWLNTLTWCSVRFLLILCGLALVGTASAAFVDLVAGKQRPLPHDLRSLADGSRRHLSRGRQSALDFGDPRVSRLVAEIEAAVWDHGDPRFQVIARDYAELLATSATALSEATAQVALDIEAMTVTSLSYLRDEIARLNRDRAIKTETDARIAVAYVQNRYGPADFTIRDD